MQGNYYDNFYKRQARSFWGENYIEQIEDTKLEKCDHEFTYKNSGVECEKCHFGLTGTNLEVRNKKLFVRGELVKGL